MMSAIPATHYLIMVAQLAYVLPCDVILLIRDHLVAMVIQSVFKGHLLRRDPPPRFGFESCCSDRKRCVYSYTCESAFLEDLERFCTSIIPPYSMQVKMSFDNGTECIIPTRLTPASSSPFPSSFHSDITITMDSFRQVLGNPTISIDLCREVFQ